jgi:phosphopantetheine adenylyltransferase
MASDLPTSSVALLLLPPPPSFSFRPVKDVFGTLFADVLVKLVKALNGSNSIATLDIVLQIPGLLSPSARPQAKVFAPLQQYLTSIYTLIGAVAAAHNIELDSPGGIDARVVFTGDSSSTPSASSGLSFGPIVDLHSLVTSGRRWNHVFYLNNEAGSKLFRDFTRTSETKNAHAEINGHAIPNISNWTVPVSPLLSEGLESIALQPHYSVIVGGTFDHLHLGHKLLLTALALTLEPPSATDQSQERLLTVGVTGDALLTNKKHAEFLESWDARFQNTAAFLRAIMDFSPNNTLRTERTTAPGPNGNFVVMKIQPNLTFKFVEIWDPYGPTITEESLTALVVSKETASGGAAVNDERAKKGWKSLAIFEVDVLQTGEAADIADGNNFESKISSTDIRRRRMNLAKV